LKLAQSYTRNNKPKLILTRGLSGSGKTTITQLILEKTGAIRIRSDVERKRIFGVKINQKDNAGIGEGIYSQRATENTYSVLLNLAESILDAGFAVIVDATFINPSYVRPFEMLANEKKTGILIIEFMASMDTLRQRIINRKHEASDADLAVLENQINHWINLDDNNIDKLIKVDTEKDIDITALVEVINKKR
ncbi:MAG: ATP-binding protein, partial [Gammaproteobacteria bacterium]|nr:ATP-binding protein [Gammaproteobacteria bacterium]